MTFTICGTRNAKEGIIKGSEILRKGGNALDAVEVAIRVVEEDLNDWTVGRGGFPNLLGFNELDAGIMTSSKQCGAVAGIRNYSCAISIARKVMELSPHVLLIGEGAEKFAHSLKFEKTILLTEDMKKRWKAAIEGRSTLLHNDSGILVKLSKRYDSDLRELLENFPLKKWYESLSQDYHGTVNVICQDQFGEIVVGVSTSGLALKFPGRVGDSPIIGAGFYASKKGAAACVGTGELTMKLLSSKMAVNDISNDLSNNKIQKIADIRIKEVNNESDHGVIQILVLNSKGEVAAATNADPKMNMYYYKMNENDNIPITVQTPIISR